jgi:hypothetical protein
MKPARDLLGGVASEGRQAPHAGKLRPGQLARVLERAVDRGFHEGARHAAHPQLLSETLAPERTAPGPGLRPRGGEGAIVHVAAGLELGHHGEDVSFDSILEKYGLTDPALLLLAQIVRAADSLPADPHPAGEGLRWIAHGFSALGYSDSEILEREFIVYDALYAECKQRTREGSS